MTNASASIVEEIVPKEMDSDEEERDNCDAFNLVAEFDAITTCIAVKEFPIVVPACNEEKRALEARMTEAVEIQSYMTARFGEFMRGNPSDAGLSVAMQETQWAHASYYLELLRHLAQKSLAENSLQHRIDNDIFVPLVLPSMIGNDIKRQEAISLMAKVQHQDLANIEKVLSASWEGMQQLLKYSSASVEEFYEAFIRENYWVAVRQVLQTRKSNTVVPKVDPSAERDKELYSSAWSSVRLAIVYTWRVRDTVLHLFSVLVVYVVC